MASNDSKGASNASPSQPPSLPSRAHHHSSVLGGPPADSLLDKGGQSQGETLNTSEQWHPHGPRSPTTQSLERNEGDQSQGETLNISEQWHSHDPRSSSTQSLGLPREAGDEKRSLLLIYVHGFMGNETSFQSFPAHVHNLLSIILAETHTVHTKLYPRYKSRKAIEFARDDFSKWLEPHENAWTDVILLGHSLGGILISEVVLLPSNSVVARSEALHHRMLGTLCFDTPFLGLHPGVILSGIGSLFWPAASPVPSATRVHASISGRAAPSLESSSSLSLNSSHSKGRPQPQNAEFMSSTTLPLSGLSSHDPYYNPPFSNDVSIAERKGWGNVLHFVNKHAEGLTAATKQYLVSHLEFGGCMADYPGMKARYSKIRRLEDVDELVSRQEQRVRFINYYTASTGRPKKEAQEKASSKSLEVSMNGVSLESEGDISMDPLGNDAATLSSNDEDQLVQIDWVDSLPIDDIAGDYPADKAVAELESSPLGDAKEDALSASQPAISNAQLPPLPPVPAEPELVDLSIYTDKDARKVAEKEQRRITRAYQQALKDRESAVKDRQKLVENRDKKARQEREKQEKLLAKQGQKGQKGEKSEQNVKETRKQKTNTNQISSPPGSPEPRTAEKARRDKKFCLLPPDIAGGKDTCWKRVYMKGVDEVGAHCGLFSPGEHYDFLVGEVGTRIEEWVKEDVRRRKILEVEGRY